MIARVVALAALLFTALLLGTVVAPAFAVAGLRPDLVTLLVLALAYTDGPAVGARFGFAAGLFVDLLSGGAGPVGGMALVLLVAGYVGGSLRPYLSGTMLAGQVTLAGAGTLLALLAYGLLGMLLDFAPAGALAIVQTALGVGLYNAVLAPFVFAPTAAIAHRFPRTSTVPATPWQPGRG